jgi:alkylation response protein AidB-like acyl-CoA dehydrogenase
MWYSTEARCGSPTRLFAQVAVVWAKDEAGDIRGLVVERGMEGFTTPTTHGKWSLRASATGELVFDNVKVPKENIFPTIKGLKGPVGCLTKGALWNCLGRTGRGHGLLRYRPAVQQGAHPVRPADRRLPAAAKKAGGDDHRDHERATARLAAGC